jgi:hypothetical protein
LLSGKDDAESSCAPDSGGSPDHHGPYRISNFTRVVIFEIDLFERQAGLIEKDQGFSFSVPLYRLYLGHDFVSMAYAEIFRFNFKFQEFIFPSTCYRSLKSGI